MTTGRAVAMIGNDKGTPSTRLVLSLMPCEAAGKLEPDPITMPVTARSVEIMSCRFESCPGKVSFKSHKEIKWEISLT